MAGNSIELLREERNEGGHGQPYSPLTRKNINPQKPIFLDPAVYFHFIFRLLFGKIK